MADEITKLDGDGGLNARVLFIYRGITPPTYNDASAQPVTVIATPSAGLPEMAVAILTTAEKSALDAGTAAFEVVTLEVSDSTTNQELLAEARALYAKQKADFLERLARRYNRAGQRFSEA